MILYWALCWMGDAPLNSRNASYNSESMFGQRYSPVDFNNGNNVGPHLYRYWIILNLFYGIKQLLPMRAAYCSPHGLPLLLTQISHSSQIPLGNCFGDILIPIIYHEAFNYHPLT